ncbi:hypothetical protein FGO68_gene5862 [Halteria grandinella]|uniref:Uncharacterized protein n=1 Tax=Halteria grandinella TaxID=5974 RepID=A0A8J8NN99_HALGN|nr:hypothetical protein FGO68_gene5862 [Halteria grandinella]
MQIIVILNILYACSKRLYPFHQKSQLPTPCPRSISSLNEVRAKKGLPFACGSLELRVLLLRLSSHKRHPWLLN